MRDDAVQTTDDVMVEAPGELTAGDVADMLRSVEAEELRLRRQSAAARFRAQLAEEGRITLLVYVNGRCIGKKTTSFWEVQGRGGLATRLHDRYSKDGDVRIIALVGDERLLVAPDDGSFIHDIAHYEAHPEEYGAPGR